MSEYKSEVKTVFAPQQRVFDKLSNLNNLSVVQQLTENPDMRQRFEEQMEGKVSVQQLDTIVEKIKTLQFDQDSVTTDAGMLGNITLRIVEREEPKCVKFALEGAPLQANLWVQLLSASEEQSAMRITLRADLNFFLKQMLGNKLQEGVNGLAQMLASIPY